MKIFWSIIKMFLAILVIFLIPFILPIILKVLVNVKFFADIEEFKNIMYVFNNIYTIIYIVIGIILLLWFFHKWENIREMFRTMNNFSFTIFGNSISAQRVVREELEDIDSQKNFISKLNQENKTSESELTIKEIKERLGLIEIQDNEICKECNKNELQEENRKLRNFAAYNMLNSEARSLLHSMYCENYIETNKFKSRIVQGYKRRNKKNVKFTKKDIDKIAQNKYDTIYEGLRFLNIIEHSEDDTVLRLTQEGKRFVEKYIEEKGSGLND